MEKMRTFSYDTEWIISKKNCFHKIENRSEIFFFTFLHAQFVKSVHIIQGFLKESLSQGPKVVPRLIRNKYTLI